MIVMMAYHIQKHRVFELCFIFPCSTLKLKHRTMEEVQTTVWSQTTT